MVVYRGVDWVMGHFGVMFSQAVADFSHGVFT
jgi:hypothetical protein